MVIKTCVICGKKFDARGRSKTCSVECRKINKKEVGRKYYENNKEAISKQKKEYRENNKEAISKYQKKYYENNKEAISKQHKEYYENNKEAIREYRENNKEAISKYQKEYRENNKEAISKYQKEYYENNKEAISKYRKEYYENNKEAINKQKKEYYENNKETISKYQKKYYENNKEAISKYKKDKITELQQSVQKMNILPVEELRNRLKKINFRFHKRELEIIIFNGNYEQSYYKDFISVVRDRANGYCELTGKQTYDGVIHHLYNFANYIELGANPDNGIYLNKEVHKRFHSKKGYNCTIDDFIDFCNEEGYDIPKLILNLQNKVGTS